jgi:thiopeptide-type bacteriocin biosynthesis protein
MPSQYPNESFFVIRTPKLPFNRLYKQDANKLNIKERLLTWLSDDYVTESLYIASPSLLERINTWKKSPDSKQGKKIEAALLKYFIRMCSRPTPFGLFSGVHLGAFSQVTNLSPSPHKIRSRKTRLDMFLLSSLKEHVQHANNENLRYYPNDSLYFIANHCRYIEAYHSNKTRQFRLSEIESNEYFNYIVASASQGRTIEELTEQFVTQYPDAEKGDVRDFIKALISESALVADIPLLLTGSAPDTSFVKSVSHIAESDTASHLNNALNDIMKLDTQGYACVDDYKRIKSGLDNLPIDVDENKLFQVDISQDFEHCEIDQNLMTSLYDKLLLINQLSNDHKNPLNNFIMQFNQRFEGQLVPLSIALDDESGIGFSNETGYESSIIAGLRLNKSETGVNRAIWPSPLELAIIRALSLPENREKPVITLKSRELKQLIDKTKKKTNLPASFGAFVSLFQDKNDNPIIKFKGCHGPSAANLLGRFCHLDEGLNNKVIAHLKKEEELSPEVIFAEIVHLPDGRPGNVIARPRLRQYEIVFMADTDTEDHYKISINDLYIWVEEGQVKLWSKRLQKQIIPRLSSAHNYSHRSLSIYKFLCTMQYQTVSAPRCTLPASFNHAHFTPRILIDNMIIHEKTWQIPRKEIVELLDADKGEEKLENLKQKYQLDNLVCFHHADNVLHLDLRNQHMLEILSSETKNRDYVELKEALITQYKSAVKTPDEEYFCNEVIIPFWNASATPYRTLNKNLNSYLETKPISRKFSPGSEWMSLKIYSGNTSVENFLVEQLSPLLEKHNDLYEKWFFIRYSDPEWHIRVRFNGDPKTLYGELLPKLNASFAPMIENEELHTVQLFTYEREVERYGGPLIINAVEQLFTAESNLITNGLYYIHEYGEEIRWRLLILITDQLLELFGYSVDDKLDLISRLRHGFGQEFKETGELRKQMGNKYHPLKQTLINDIESFSASQTLSQDKTHQVIFPLMNKWKEAVKPHIDEINKTLPSLTPFTKNDLLSSILHMSNNRMFKAYGREHELAMHDFMRRFYLYQSKKVNH